MFSEGCKRCRFGKREEKDVVLAFLHRSIHFQESPASDQIRVAVLHLASDHCSRGHGAHPALYCVRLGDQVLDNETGDTQTMVKSEL